MLKAQLTTQNVNGKNLPAFKVLESNFTIDKKDLKIDLSGGFTAKVIDFFASVLKGTIVNQITI